MIGRADDDGIDLIGQLVKQSPKIDILFRRWKTLERIASPFVVHVAQRHNILIGQLIQIAASLSADANDRQVQLFVRRFRSQPRTLGTRSNSQRLAQATSAWPGDVLYDVS